MRRFMLLLTAASVLSLSSCEDDNSSEGAYTDLTGLSLSDMKLKVGDQVTLDAVRTPDNADVKSVSWASSDEAIVKVNQNGQITAVKKGTATITIQSSKYTNITASCTVTVDPATITYNANGGKGTVPAQFTIDETTKIDTKDLASGAGLSKTERDVLGLAENKKDTIFSDTYECDFLGWGDKSGKLYTDKYEASKTDTLWAVWKRNNYVDLGLPSQKIWASSNLEGAFAWAETTAKSVKDSVWSKYSLVKFNEDKESSIKSTSAYFIGKYCNAAELGFKTIDGEKDDDKKDVFGSFADNILALAKEDDAAAKIWGSKDGSNWSTPKAADFVELFNNCYCVYTSNYNDTKTAGYIFFKAKADADKGVTVLAGQTASDQYASQDVLEDVEVEVTKDGKTEKVKAKQVKAKRDNHIFLPAGEYWTADLSAENPYEAQSVTLDKDGKVKATATTTERRFVLQIRPVRQ